MSKTEVYSSVHLKERDRILVERHQKELASFESKINRLKWSNTDLLRQLFDAQNRGLRLAMSLGFNDINEAQVAIHNADHCTAYKDCIEGLAKLRNELAKEKSENERLREEVRRAKEERDKAGTKVVAAGKEHVGQRTLAPNSSSASLIKPSYHAISLELAQLRERYDSLVDVKERAAERFRVEYKRWREVKKWLFYEQESDMRDQKDSRLSKEEKRRRHIKSVLRKRKLFMQMGPNLSILERDVDLDLRVTSHEPLFTADPESDKENQDTPVPSTKNNQFKPSSDLTLIPPSSTLVPASIFVLDPNSPLAAATPVLPHLPESYISNATASSVLSRDSAPASTPLVRLPTPLQPTSIVNNVISSHVMQRTSSPPKSSSIRDWERPLKQHCPSRALIPNSSDTEDDSQVHPLPVLEFRVPALPIPNNVVKPIILGRSSDTEEVSHNMSSSVFVLDPNSPLASVSPILPHLPEPFISKAIASPVLSRDSWSAPASTAHVQLPTPSQPTPITNNVSSRVKQKKGTPSKPSSIVSCERSLKQHCPGKALVPNSSDTEEDSQVSLFKVSASVTSNTNPKPIIPGGSSNNEEGSHKWVSGTIIPTPEATPIPLQKPAISRVPAHPSLPSRPSFPQFGGGHCGHKDVPTMPLTSDSERPRKIRRVSGDEVIVPRSSNSAGSAIKCSSSLHENPPQKTCQNTRENGKDTRGSTNERDLGRTPKPKDGAKGQEKGTQSDLSARSNPNKGGLDDYSAYKGRGRYAQETPANKTINSTYVIDPSRNGGLDFQYDEVVRRKEDRRKMGAGDCECCRDYYEGVGPLPKRLKQPLWRSPTKPCSRHPPQHQSSSNNTRRHSDSEREQSINSHKQAISRHRHHWARATTPPGYWNIGFPDTQEAEAINERASEMHRKKREAVEAGVRNEEGRYRKR